MEVSNFQHLRLRIIFLFTILFRLNDFKNLLTGSILSKPGQGRIELL